MESKWGYRLTQKAAADLEDIAEYMPWNWQIQKRLRIVYGRRNIDEFLRKLNV